MEKRGFCNFIRRNALSIIAIAIALAIFILMLNWDIEGIKYQLSTLKEDIKYIKDNYISKNEFIHLLKEQFEECADQYLARIANVQTIKGGGPVSEKS